MTSLKQQRQPPESNKDANALNDAYETMMTSFVAQSSSSGAKEPKTATQVLVEFCRIKGDVGGGKMQFECETSSSGECAAFLLLPGGCCFGNFTAGCASPLEAQESAARAAFVASVFDAHPSKTISPRVIEAILLQASFSFVDDPSDRGAVEAFDALLRHHMGDSFMRLQASITVFQMLHWNGEIAEFRRNGCTREEVIRHYCHRAADAVVEPRFRRKLVEDWTRRARQDGVQLIDAELSRALGERDVMTRSGRECRFSHEKVKILREVKLCLVNM